MTALVAIAANDLRLRLRDRSLFIIGLAAPLGLAIIFNLVFGSAFDSDDSPIEIDLGLVVEPEADAAIGEGLAGTLAAVEESGLVRLTDVAGGAEARAAIDDGDLEAAVVLGPAEGGRPARITVLGDADAPLAATITESIVREFAVRADRITVSVGAVLALDPAQDPDALAGAAQSAPSPFTLSDFETGRRELDPATFSAAGLAAFFAFFLAGTGSVSLLQERQEGTLARLLAAPHPGRVIVAAKAASSAIIAAAAMGVLVIATTVTMGADWGRPAGVALLVLALVFALVAIMTSIGGFARTAEQAGNMQSVVALTFALLGGTFVQVTPGTGLLANLRYASPNGWFMRGLAEMSGGDIGPALPAVAVLLGFGAVFSVIAASLSNRVLRP